MTVARDALVRHTVVRDAGVVVGGIVLGVLLAAATGMPLRDAALLLVMAFAAATASHVGGRLLASSLHRRGRDSVRSRAVIVALVPLVSLAVGALVAARAMFVSTHDLAALVVVLSGAGTAGLLAALAVAREIERTQGELVAARERERMLDRSRRELVAWVSHDLRTPLAGIRAMAEALDDGVVTDAETVARYHATMTRDVDRLAGLVDDLFELSRIQADALHMELEEVSLGEVVSGAVASASVVAGAKGVRLHGRLGEPAEVMASIPELGRVVHNLLDNAIRHTPSGGEVRVEVDEHADHAVLSVRDQCGGIAVDDIEQVFDLAYRGDSARTPGNAGGAGLGLAIVRGLVQAHAGEVVVRNESDGCRFIVRLPLADPSPVRADPRDRQRDTATEPRSRS